jgi:16S rRNA G1207 methylase RsmC
LQERLGRFRHPASRGTRTSVYIAGAIRNGHGSTRKYTEKMQCPVNRMSGKQQKYLFVGAPRRRDQE